MSRSRPRSNRWWAFGESPPVSRWNRSELARWISGFRSLDRRCRCCLRIQQETLGGQQQRPETMVCHTSDASGQSWAHTHFLSPGEAVTAHFSHRSALRSYGKAETVAGRPRWSLERVRSGLRTSRRSVDLSGFCRAGYGFGSRRNGRPGSAISFSPEVGSRRRNIPPWGSLVNTGNLIVFWCAASPEGGASRPLSHRTGHRLHSGKPDG